MKIMALIALLMTGCVHSRMVQTYGSKPSKYAPTNEKKGGTVSYSLDARQSVIKKSREAAYKRMYEFCQGEYGIVSEGGKSSGSTGMTLQATPQTVPMFTSFNSNEWQINFACK